ncbi:MAG: hypothetical protein Q9187_005389 [Circinaria calcarea]
MAPTESTILTNFLLPPSPLPTILSLQKFTSLFPKAQRSNPQVKYLYRELQHLRALDIDEVKQNIVREVKVGEKQRREVVRARRRADKVEIEGFDEREVEMEAQMFGHSSIESGKQPHTLSSILRGMERACADIEEEIEASESQIQSILQDIESTVGALSDLRYGKFSQPLGLGNDTRDNVLDGLQALEKHSTARISYTMDNSEFDPLRHMI